METTAIGHVGFRMYLYGKLKRFSLDFSLQCDPGEILALVGPSGAGKTTLLRGIAGFFPPDKGWMRLNDKILLDTEAGIYLRPQQRKIGLVTQDYTLFPHMTVLENVAFACSASQDAMRLLARSGICHLAGEKPGRISGGERQRVALCRVLAMEPDMLLMDEPFSALDVESRYHLQRLVKEMSEERHLPVVHVTHDLSNAASFADRIMAINQGKEDAHWLESQWKFLNGEDDEKSVQTMDVPFLVAGFRV